MFCKHEWKILNSFVVDSEVDNLHSLGLRPKSFNSAQRIHVTDLTCPKCGKLKRLSIRTPR